MKRWLVLFCGLMVKLCLGGVYAWSVFDVALKAEHGMSALQTQAVFGTLFAAFTGTMVLAGRLLKHVGPRRMVLLAGLLFGGGFLLAGSSGGRFPLVLLGIGVLCGTGVGVAYVTILATVLAWFPRKKGLATGMIVAAFGGGAVAMTALGEGLMGAGLGVLASFRIIGLSYGGVILACALGLAPVQTPTADAQPQGPTASRAFGTLMFWLLCAGMFGGTFAGMLVIGSLKSIGLAAGLAEQVAAAAVSVFAVGNAVGRVSWGVIHDRLFYRALPLAMLGLAVATLALLVSYAAPVFLVVTFAVGFGFGACFVLYPAQVARSFGAPAVATVYPVIFLFYGLSSMVGPVLAGSLFEHLESYLAALALAGSLALLGAATLWIGGRRTEKTNEAQFEPAPLSEAG